MDANEVILEKIKNDISSSDKSRKEIYIEKNDDTSNIEVLSSAYKENMQNNDLKTSQITNDCEVILIDKNVETEQHCDKKSNINEQLQKITETLSVTQNEVLIQNNNHSSSEDQSINKHVPMEELKQKDNDMYIVYEKNSILPTKTNDKVSSLVSIAVEYNNSDSETEDTSDITIGCENNKNAFVKEVQTYRQNKEVSLSEDSEDEDDSTSSSDSSVITESSDSDSDDNTNKKSKRNNMKGQKSNEIKSELDDLPPIEELKISVPEVLCDLLGEIAWMVEQLVVVKPRPGKPTLNLDTVLFIEKGQRALGKIFDVFGQVNEPHYCIRFNSSEHIQECDIKVGMTVYYCPNTEYTSLVFLHELMKIKGIDATADEPPEFSDDEEERVYYEKLKAKQTNMSNETNIQFKRKRTSNPTTGWQSNHPWNRNTQKHKKGNYPRGDRKQFSFMQVGNQSQNLWPQSYQNSWQSTSRNLHSESNEQYGYGTYSLQPMQYVNNINQNFYSSHSYYNEDGTTAPLNPRIPFNVCPRVPPGYLPFHNRPSSSPNLRFQNANMPWQSQVPQIPMRMKIPWIPVPPPPPPPTTSPSGTN